MWAKSAKDYEHTFALVTSQAANALLDGAGVEQTATAAAKKVYSISPATFPKYNHAAVPSPKVSPDEAIAALPAPIVPSTPSCASVSCAAEPSSSSTLRSSITSRSR